MELISGPLGLAGRGIGAVDKGLRLARANTWAMAGDLLGGRGDNPLDQRDPDFIRATLPGNSQIANVLFRPKVRGLEHIPAEGPVLLVGNHSGGTMIIDTFVFSFAFYKYFGPERRFHQLAHDLAVGFPALSALIRGYGTLPAAHEHAERALDAGAAVLVYPGGDYESFRPSWHSEQVEFGGRKGFVSLALSQDVPIVPVVSIGGQESALFVSRGERIAKLLMLDRLLRIKVLPVVFGPPFGLSIMDLPPRLPLPSQVTIRVLPAIDLRERFGAEPDDDEVYEAITAAMQDALDGLSDERDVPVVGTVWSDRSGDEDDAEPEVEEQEVEAPEAPSSPDPLPAQQEPARGRGDDESASQATRDPGAASASELSDLPQREDLPDLPEPSETPAAAEPQPPPPSPQIEEEPNTLVAAVAEPGAEDGAGAELRVEEPWDGYARMKVAEISDHVSAISNEALLAVRLFEVTHKNRRGVLTAVERELKQR
jgi:1-acyl-sn-glycerol-3-phosphate acyltransferase